MPALLAILLGLGASVARAEEPAAVVEPETPAETYPKVAPYAVFVGGAAGERIDRRDDGVDDRQGRVWTPAVARLGLAGKLSAKFTIDSEIEFNTGPYGTSVWEGQAAIQVRNQLVRYQETGLIFAEDRLRIEVGRITDPASVNFISPHIANLLLSDELARFPLLTSGFNRANGVRLDYTLKDRLVAGFTLNAGNPTSTTSTVMIGGTFPPFQRFYEVPWSVVGRDARGFPASNFHVIMASPSLRYTGEFLTAQVAAQTFVVDTNTNLRTDENMRGTNLRGGLRAQAFEGRLAAFGNASRIINDVVELEDSSRIADAKFLGITVGGGLDVNIPKKGGFGVQYDRVREQQRGLDPEIRHFLNVGGTLFVSRTVYLAARVAVYDRCQDNTALERCNIDGRQQAMLTMNAILGPTPDVMP